MKHCGTKTIETERLLLRPFCAADAGPMYRNWASDSEVTRFLTWPPHANVEASLTVIEGWVEQYDSPERNFYQWAIALKGEEDNPIGSISVVALDEKTEMAEIGYCIGRDRWHTGITSEALRAVIDLLFDEVGANRIQAKHDANNPNSGRVMKKCGMSYEGTMRQAGFNNCGICDLCCYAILKTER